MHLYMMIQLHVLFDITQNYFRLFRLETKYEQPAHTTTKDI